MTDTVPNSASAAQPTPQREAVIPKKPGNKGLFIVIIGLLLIITILLCVLIFPILAYFRDNDETEQKVSNTAVPTVAATEVIVKPTNTAFTGKYVTASLPAGWTVVEKYDGDGSDMLMSGATYTGLSFLSINKNNTAVLTLSAAYGIGGSDSCDSVLKFQDTPQSYLDGINDMTKLALQKDVTIIDLTNKKYNEFRFLGLLVRRYDSTLAWNMNSQGTEFLPACGLNGMFPQFSDISLNVKSDAYNDKVTAFQAELNPNFINSDLDALVVIMQSMKVK
ncbi:MAG: hypothetical protein WCJ58_07065 [bacterium]